MTILKALHNQSGVQKMSVQIQPDDETIAPMANVVFVGIFKRGRVDCPFKVTETNYRAKLGYDPRNKVFQAIEDAFKTGISSVWVQRVANISDKENNAPWGDWVLNSGVVITGGMARYTGYKTNGYKYFDSFADIDLTDAIIRSFHDDDMQQWQGFLDAVNDLIGSVDWVLDPANNRVIYYPPSTDPDNPSVQFLYKIGSNGKLYTSADQACVASLALFQPGRYSSAYASLLGSQWRCNYIKTDSSDGGADNITKVANPAYDPNAEAEEKYLPLPVVAEKVISNAQGGDTNAQVATMAAADIVSEGKSLLAEVYVETVANSIFNPDESKQFLKLSDLLSQFELNKTLRT